MPVAPPSLRFVASDLPQGLKETETTAVAKMAAVLTPTVGTLLILFPKILLF